MGFFSEIASEARCSMATPVRQTVTPPAAPEPAPAPPVAAPETPAAQPVPTPPAPAEAKRKAEFDAKQAEKRAKQQAALDQIKAMNDADLLSAAVGRVAADTERLTRRNMKEAVAEHIQVKCREDAAFAMLVMDPDKSMVNCFQYINRKAREYAEQEMKDNGIERRGVYGLDVPDGLCYQWGEDYFNDPDAKEDNKNEEKFVPKPYIPATRKKTQGKTAKKLVPAEKPKAEKPAGTGMEQLTLGVV